MPDRETHPKLVEAWLRFHRDELCQKLDSVFVFDGAGVEIWCVVESRRHYERLQRLFEPLRGAFRVDLYPTWPTPDWKKKMEDPPPSLCENRELRAYLEDPFLRFERTMENFAGRGAIFPPDEVLKRRLLAYAEQLLGWSERIRRYGSDLPGLVSVAADPERSPHLRKTAGSVCRAHARNLAKTVRRMKKELAYAIPRAGREPVDAASRAPRGGDAGEGGEAVARAAGEVFRGVKRFLYPERHTVAVDDLRSPGLLESLGDLEEAAARLEILLDRIRPS
ncbi:MAG: hypothetical protein QM330_01970 [Acidobacteriota bacterium]|jgi:hypothetical protein|nr:hypothetical protein [Acidobacteriota bacterium]NLT33025.1 hypothetical protein [Acidobacteriota bacterium]